MASPRTAFRASPSASLVVLGLLLWPLPLLATGEAPRSRQIGDLNGDGMFTRTDPIARLLALFHSGPPPVPMDCGMNSPSGRNGDADGNQRIEVTDAVYLLGSLFLGGPQPVPIPCSTPLIHKSEITNMTLFLVDERGRSLNSLPPPATLIYEQATGVPIPATDGHPMTLAEFLQVRGSVSVGCTSLGTHAVLELTGLVPNGLYTIWVVTFKSPGYHEAGFDTLIGNGA